MIWVYVFIMVFLIGWVWLKRQYKKDFIRCHKKELSWCLPIAPGMLWITDWWYGKDWGKRERKIYTGSIYKTKTGRNKIHSSNKNICMCLVLCDDWMSGSYLHGNYGKTGNSGSTAGDFTSNIWTGRGIYIFRRWFNRSDRRDYGNR